jgi:hypothetical protein
MHGPINVKSPNNTNKWQIRFNSVFKGLMIFRIGLWNDSMENIGHTKRLTSLGTSANRLSNLWHYTLNQKGSAGFKISGILAWITMLLLRSWITLTDNPFAKKIKPFVVFGSACCSVTLEYSG